MAKSNGSAMMVIKIPLKLRPYEADTLDSRLRVCCSIYNAMLGERKKTYNAMCEIPEYAEAKLITDAVTKHEGSKEEIQKVKELRNSGEYKKALEIKRDYHTKYNFSEFGFKNLIKFHRDYFKDIIPSNLASLTIAVPMWSAFEKLLYKNGKDCSFKRADDCNSLTTDGKSGIRIVDENGKTSLRMEKGGKYFLSVTSKKGKQLLIPIKIDPKDTYLAETLGRDIHIIQLVRKKVKSKSTYCLHLCVEGAPPVKYNKDGDLLHPIGKGMISVFTDEQYFTVADRNGNITEIDISFPSGYDERKEEIQQKMDESRRVMNPQNLNPDGSFKRRKDNPGERLVWNYSKTYKRLAGLKADIDRKQRETRRIRSNIIANQILSLGDDITINDRPFRTNIGGGTYKENIAKNAPSQILTVLKQKMKAAGLGEPHEYKLPVKKEDKSRPGYRADYAKELLHIRLQDIGEE